MNDEIEGIATPLQMVAAALREPDGLTVERCDAILLAARERLAEREKYIEGEEGYSDDPTDADLADAASVEESLRESKIEIRKLTAGISRLESVRDDLAAEAAEAERSRIEAAFSSEFDAVAAKVIERVAVMRELGGDLRELQRIIVAAKRDLGGQFSRSFTTIGIESFHDQIEGIHGALHVATGFLRNVPAPSENEEMKNAA